MRNNCPGRCIFLIFYMLQYPFSSMGASFLSSCNTLLPLVYFAAMQLFFCFCFFHFAVNEIIKACSVMAQGLVLSARLLLPHYGNHLTLLQSI